MVNFFIFVFIISTLAIIVGAIAYSFYANKKRREALMQTAESLGLTFFPDGDAALLSSFGGFQLFQRGRSRKMRNLIQGDSGEVKIAIFDYQFVTGSGDKSRTHVQSIIALQSPSLVPPEFIMRPEGLFDRIGGALGFQDIDFESHPTFSDAFVLKGPDEAAIRSYFTPQLLEFFERKPGYSVEARPGTMFFYRAYQRLKADDVKDQLSKAYEVFGVMVDQNQDNTNS